MHARDDPTLGEGEGGELGGVERCDDGEGLEGVSGVWSIARWGGGVAGMGRW